MLVYEMVQKALEETYRLDHITFEREAFAFEELVGYAYWATLDDKEFAIIAEFDPEEGSTLNVWFEVDLGDDDFIYEKAGQIFI